MEGAYKVQISVVKITDDSGKDNQIFDTEPLGSLIIKPEDTSTAFKQQVLDLYNAERPEAKLTIDDFRLRSPNYDLGEIIHETTWLSSIYMDDDKEFYMHPAQEGKYIPYTKEISDPQASVSVLVREWDPESWQLSPIREV